MRYGHPETRSRLLNTMLVSSNMSLIWTFQDNIMDELSLHQQACYEMVMTALDGADRAASKDDWELQAAAHKLVELTLAWNQVYGYMQDCGRLVAEGLAPDLMTTIGVLQFCLSSDLDHAVECARKDADLVHAGMDEGLAAQTADRDLYERLTHGPPTVDSSELAAQVSERLHNMETTMKFPVLVRACATSHLALACAVRDADA